jgi:hypothetical protein
MVLKSQKHTPPIPKGEYMKIGEKINKLTLIKKLDYREYGNQGKTVQFGVFECECGKSKEIIINSVKYGKQVSCGCARNLTKNAYKHGLSYHRLCTIYSMMNTRCFNKNYPKYCDYGGRGIIVCEEWKNDIMAFYNWAINNGYKEGLAIDRIDNNGNYEPSNCQWITQAENNAIGKRRQFAQSKIKYNGVSHNGISFVVNIGVDNKLIYLGSFKTIEEAVEARINAEIKYLGEQKTNFHYVKK